MKPIAYLLGAIIGWMFATDSTTLLPFLLVSEFFIIIYLLTSRKIRLGEGRGYWIILSEKERFKRIRPFGVRDKDIKDLALLKSSLRLSWSDLKERWQNG